MLIDVISIFPDLFAPVLSVGMTGRALGRGVVAVHYTDPRTFTEDKHRTVDDSPYGGGSGMVMRVEPLVDSLRAIEKVRGPGHRILLTPTGAALSQATVRRLAKLPHLVLLCGRYEGVDDRISRYVDDLPVIFVPSYIEMDVRLAWKMSHNTELSVVGQNLLDPHHPEYPGQPPSEIKRGVYAMITRKW